MKVPSSLPLSEAWSPVGYQVVQIAEENGPPQARPQEVPAPPEPVPPAPARYQAVQIAEESAPVDPPIYLRTPQLRRRLTERPRSGMNLALIVAIGGACFLGFLIVASVVVSRTTAPQLERKMVAGRWGMEAVIPAEFKDDIAPPVPEPRAAAAPALVPVKKQAAASRERKRPEERVPAAPDKGECIACAAGGARPGRETFGTSVQFVRNPQEAFRLARDERKLTCLLHVAGNFEDSRFT